MSTALHRRAVIAGLLAPLVLAGAGCGPSDADFVEFDTYSSPDGQYRVQVRTAPSRRMAFSPEAVRFYSVGADESETKLLATTRLANDGSRLTDRNIRAQWTAAGTLQLCLSGAEQDDEVVIIDVAAEASSSRSEACAD